MEFTATVHLQPSSEDLDKQRLESLVKEILTIVEKHSDNPQLLQQAEDFLAQRQ